MMLAPRLGIRHASTVSIIRRESNPI